MLDTLKPTLEITVIIPGIILAYFPVRTCLRTSLFNIVISLTLLALLVLFYAMFLMLANNLNKNAKLLQENHFLSMQRERYDSLKSSIEEARQARHDMRHYFNQLAALAENGDMDGIKSYLSRAVSKIPNLDKSFCENRAADSVLGYYYAIAEQYKSPGSDSH